jgi:olefin beta-lactone synthetase
MVGGGDDLTAVLSSVGLDPQWSRRLRLDVEGTPEMHVLDRPAQGVDAAVDLTVVCLHGNPTWSVLWTPLLTGFDRRLRVVAIDQIDMGWSQRVTPPGGVRPFEQRVADLDAALRGLEVSGPVLLVGHDWGGAVAMGWAVEQAEQAEQGEQANRVAGLVLANTGIAIPAGRNAPWLIRLAARRGVLDTAARRSALFVRATYRLPGRPLDASLRRALVAPYATASRRHGVAGFVADVPFDDRHPSAEAIARVADGLSQVHCRVLLVWGARDPVFDDRFAHDLRRRLPQAELHRDPAAGHVSPLETDFVGMVQRWLDARRIESPALREAGGSEHEQAVRAWTMLERRSDDDAIAFHDGARDESVTFAELHRRVMVAVAALGRSGVRPGDRLGVLVPPSIDLVTTVYASWRLGAVPVIADRGLGLRGLGAALRGAQVNAVVGIGPALRVASLARWAPNATLIAVDDLRNGNPARGVDIPEPHRDAPAAVLFTSGATGPAKGVRYTHRQLEAQRDALMATYAITSDDRLVAAFAPFSLYGPAMGITSALPDVDVTAPATLTATALEQACAAVEATLVFASPAALTNVVDTAPSTSLPALAKVRTVMSAGAPIPVALLEHMARLTPKATLHTPYGMTEVLPVADIDLVALQAVGDGRGVCVGAPVVGCRVMIAEPGTGEVIACPPGATGEVLVHSDWCSEGYDQLADTQRRARPQTEVLWHRSGDLGHVDEAGRVWIEGRVVHGIAATGARLLTPVPLEWSAQRVPGVRRAAAVGVGPHGVQQVVIVVEVASPTRRRRRPLRLRLAAPDMAEAVRDAVARDHPDVAVAAVLVVNALPVDIRHNAKIDRTAVARAAERYVAGQQP